MNKKLSGIKFAQNNKRLEVEMTSKSKILGRKVLLNLIGHPLTVWAMAKLCGSYKYVGLLV